MRRHLAGETVEAKKEIAMLAMVKARREAAAAQRAETGRAAGWVMKDSDEESSGSEDSDSDSSDDEPKKKTAGGKKSKSAEPVKKDLGAMTKEVADKKRAKAAAPAENDGGLEKITPIEIKKMNPAAIKDTLKERGQSTQGQKKDLIKRLTDYEAAR